MLTTKQIDEIEAKGASASWATLTQDEILGLVAMARKGLDQGARTITPTHRHWKGALYRKLHDATFEATMELAVVYQSCEDGRIWVRTQVDFEGLVDRSEHTTVYRFAPIDPSPEPAAQIDTAVSAKGGTGCTPVDGAKADPERPGIERIEHCASTTWRLALEQEAVTLCRYALHLEAKLATIVARAQANAQYAFHLEAKLAKAEADIARWRDLASTAGGFKSAYEHEVLEHGGTRDKLAETQTQIAELEATARKYGWEGEEQGGAPWDFLDGLIVEARGHYCKACGSPRLGDICWKCGGPTHFPHPKWEEPTLPPIDPIRRLAREVGYAIAVHGSMERDLDLVAVPWAENAVSAEELIGHLEAGLPAKTTGGPPTQKPLGRVAVTLNLTEHVWTKSIDLSIAPLANAESRAQKAEARIAELQRLATEHHDNIEGKYAEVWAERNAWEVRAKKAEGERDAALSRLPLTPQEDPKYRAMLAQIERLIQAGETLIGERNQARAERAAPQAPAGEAQKG